MSDMEKNRKQNAKDRARDLHSDGFPILAGDDDKSRWEYVMAIYGDAVAKACEAIDWYLVKKRPQKMWAQWLRLAAILFTVVGGLIPLISGSTTLGQGEAVFSRLGYVALALAGACIALDKFFGFSSAWIRYLTTATTLQRTVAKFQLDWAILCVSVEVSSPTRKETMLRRILAFVRQVRSTVEKETAEWASEYRRNLAEMEKSTQEQLETSRPGTINVTIPNVEKAVGGVTVLLDGAPMQSASTSECQLRPVFPGEHLITIKGKVGRKNVIASASLRVEPGHTHTLTLALPDDSSEAGASKQPG